jgi:hypothetical protein
VNGTNCEDPVTNALGFFPLPGIKIMSREDPAYISCKIAGCGHAAIKVVLFYLFRGS